MQTYEPRVFDCANIDAAKRIILMPEQGLSTEERWGRETEWLLPRLKLDDAPGLLADYGCGIGRVSKSLVQHAVIGVDISPTMRQQAVEYVDRPDFCSMSPVMFAVMVGNGLKVSAIIAIWTLQHIPMVKGALQLIAQALPPGGTLYTLDRDTRYIPVTDETGFGWMDDGLKIEQELRTNFNIVTSEDVPESLCAPGARLIRWRRHG